MWSAALALSLAGGVYLAAPANASNMGFKLERSMDFKRTAAAGNAPLPNIYWASFPAFNGLGDVADGVAINPATSLPYSNKCVGDPTGPPGPAGDGLINSFDIICDWWTDRLNAALGNGAPFSVLYYDTATCSRVPTAATRVLGNPSFGASTPFPATGDLATDIGYQVNVGPAPGGDQVNRAVIVGSHDPSFTGRTIHFSTTCGTAAARTDLVAMPYHTMYTHSAELLCGLEGVAWADNDNNDVPDDPPPAGFGVCDGGIFDNQNGATHAITVSTFHNDDPAVGGEVGIEPQAARKNLNVFGLVPLVPFQLIPGEAYLLNISAAHVDTVLRYPHF
jgi:hypothetical protein